MPQYPDGTLVNEAKWTRLLGSIPTSYTIFKQGSTYYGECNVPGGSDITAGTDAAIVIQAAINGLTANAWGRIHFRAGEYEVGATLDLTGKYSVVLTGEGRGRPIDQAGGSWKVEGTVLKLADGTDDHLIKMVETTPAKLTGVVIRDLTLYGNAVNQTAGAASDIIHLEYVKEAVIERCTIQRARRYAVSLTNACENNWIINNDIRNDGYGKDVVYQNSAISTKILRNLIQGAPSGYRGVYLSNSSHYNYLHGNYITDNNYGIRVENSDKNKILSNYIADNGVHGIMLYNGADYTLIADNDIRNNATDGVAFSASGTNCTNTQIFRNVITNHGQYGVNLTARSVTTDVLDNKWASNTTGNLNDSGVNTGLDNVPVNQILDDADANATLSNIGDHLTISCADAQNVAVRFNFVTPQNFLETITAKLYVVSPCAGGTVMRWNVTSDFGTADEDYNVHSDSIAATDTTLAANKFEELDLSAALTGLAAGDRVGIAFTREGSHANDTLGDVLHIHSFALRHI